MQNYSDVINELKSSQELCTQLECRCAEMSSELDQTKTAMKENQQAFDVIFLRILDFIDTNDTSIVGLFVQ